jgi:hypothetical protein
LLACSLALALLLSVARRYWTQGGYCGEASVRSAAAAFGVYAPDSATRARLGLAIYKESGQVLVQDNFPQGVPGARVHDALRMYGLRASPTVLADASAFKQLVKQEAAANRPLIFTVYISDPGHTDSLYDHIVIAQGVAGSGASEAVVFDDHYSRQWNCRPFSSFSQSRSACTAILQGSDVTCTEEWYTAVHKGACFCALPKDPVVTVNQDLAAKQVRTELDVFTSAARATSNWRQKPGKSDAEGGWNLDKKTFDKALRSPAALWATLRISGVSAGTRLQIKRWDLPWASKKDIINLSSGVPSYVHNVTAASPGSWNDSTSFAPTTVVIWKVFTL